MKVIAILLILITFVSAYHNRMTRKEKAEFTELMQSNSWGGMILRLAEVGALANSPIDQLLEALATAADELKAKKKKAIADYEKASAKHDAEIKELEKNKQSLEVQIENIENLIKSLKAQKASLEKENVVKKTENKEISAEIKKKKKLRTLANKVYVEQTKENKIGAKAVGQCLRLLKTLQGKPTFIQLRSTQKALRNIHADLQQSRMTSAHIALALIDFAMKSESTDDGAIEKVVVKFQEIMKDLSAAQLKLDHKESKERKEFANFMKHSLAKVASNQLEIKSNKKALEQNRQTTEEQKNLRTVRIKDLNGLKNDIKQENENYKKLTTAYEDLKKQLIKEMTGIAKATAVFKSADFGDNIKKRVMKSQKKSGLLKNKKKK